MEIQAPDAQKTTVGDVEPPIWNVEIFNFFFMDIYSPSVFHWQSLVMTSLLSRNSFILASLEL